MHTAEILYKIADFIAEFGYLTGDACDEHEFQWRCGMSDMLYILGEETLSDFMMHFNDTGTQPVCTVNGKDFYKG